MTRSERSERMARVESLLAGVKRVKDKINTESPDRMGDEKGNGALSHHSSVNSRASHRGGGSNAPSKNPSFGSRPTSVGFGRLGFRGGSRRLCNFPGALLLPGPSLTSVPPPTLSLPTR
jgi:hypothetical protein